MEIQTAEETTSGIHLPCELLTIETLGSETLYLVNSDAGQFQVKSFNNPLMNTEKIHVTIPFDKLYYFDTQGNRVYVDELPFESMGKEVRGEVLI